VRRRRRATAVVVVAGGRRRGQTPSPTSAWRIITGIISIVATGWRAIVGVRRWVMMVVGAVVRVAGRREVTVIRGRRGGITHAVSVSISIAARRTVRPVAQRGGRRHGRASVAWVGWDGTVVVRRGGVLVMVWWWWGRTTSMVNGRQTELKAEVTEDGAHVPTVAADELGDTFVQSAVLEGVFEGLSLVRGQVALHQFDQFPQLLQVLRVYLKGRTAPCRRQHEQAVRRVLRRARWERRRRRATHAVPVSVIIP
jgi:hypothetical protein